MSGYRSGLISWFAPSRVSGLSATLIISHLAFQRPTSFDCWHRSLSRHVVLEHFVQLDCAIWCQMHQLFRCGYAIWCQMHQLFRCGTRYAIWCQMHQLFRCGQMHQLFRCGYAIWCQMHQLFRCGAPVVSVWLCYLMSDAPVVSVCVMLSCQMHQLFRCGYAIWCQMHQLFRCGYAIWCQMHQLFRCGYAICVRCTSCFGVCYAIWCQMHQLFRCVMLSVSDAPVVSVCTEKRSYLVSCVHAASGPIWCQMHQLFRCQFHMQRLYIMYSTPLMLCLLSTRSDVWGSNFGIHAQSLLMYSVW